MPMATLTTKGQLTIPKKIREALKLKAGDKVELILTNDGEAILRPVSKSVDELFGKFQNKSKRPSKQPVSVEDMDLGIKNRIKAQYK